MARKGRAPGRNPTPTAIKRALAQDYKAAIVLRGDNASIQPPRGDRAEVTPWQPLPAPPEESK